ncbi:MAG: hypothetical protein LBS55_06600 [Prevotellaceae bacterium]|nr:hypothetical protein [Prevotellaceae bacterium]
MEEKELQIVTFEQAKRLKELGFDWGTICRYSFRKLNRGGLKVTLAQPPTIRDYIDWNTRGDMYGWNFISAPTVALALKWFRDEKNALFCINYPIDGCSGYYWEAPKLKGDNKSGSGGILFNTYEVAEMALLDDLLSREEHNLK